MATIYDVAHLAGVSKSTVSRVLNNSPLISPETRSRVLKVMEACGFAPNVLARNFATGKTSLIALLINVENERAFSNPFFDEILHGIEQRVYQFGFSLMVANQASVDIVQLVKEHRIDGLILPSLLSRSTETLETLKELEFPFVVAGEYQGPVPGVTFVDVDNVQGGRLAMEHLAVRGYSHAGFLAQNLEDSFTQRRLQGFRSPGLSVGCSLDESAVIVAGTKATPDAGYQSMKTLLEQSPGLDSLICNDNILAFGAMKYLRETGRDVPGSLGVLSFDETQVAELCDPPLTTIKTSVTELGDRSAERLIEKILSPKTAENESQNSEWIPTRLIERKSTHGKK